jgi:AcrR family transcriptional regulator
MGGLSDARQQLFLFCLTLADRFRGEGLDAALDEDVAGAFETLASTYETASHGLIYEPRGPSVPAQRLAGEIRGVFEELGRGRPSGFAGDAAEVLRRLGDRVRATRKREPANPRAFIELAGRIAHRFSSDPATGPSAPHDGQPPAGPALIIP